MPHVILKDYLHYLAQYEGKRAKIKLFKKKFKTLLLVGKNL